MCVCERERDTERSDGGRKREREACLHEKERWGGVERWEEKIAQMFAPNLAVFFPPNRSCSL